ncbi:hypothetical protein BX600DRAFT_157932 [Xylariales sp. PMI_506]|nr:hypothetical protein BX600DRAFT_157932 [Xylariales sp. PMI_506]
MAPQPSFKVVIAGGSIAGLTLANMLEQFGIDYVLLEAYAEIAPQLGASIGLMPNGLRILDQIGCYDPVQKEMGQYSQAAYVRRSDGSVIATTDLMWNHLEQRFGYPIAFIDRQTLLQVLYAKLKDKSKIHTNARVANVEITDSGVEVTTTSGAKFKGDIVVGADGVHSAVRKEMRRIANKISPEYFVGDEESRVPVQYKCLFGISKPVPGFPTGTENFAFNRGYSFFIVPGPEGRIYWFLFSNVDKTLYGNDIPVYTKADEEVLVKKHIKHHITENVTFGDLYAARISAVLVPLQEHVFEHWYFKRIITIGDSAHKQNPIGGQGGNGAIESGAALVNALLRKMDARPTGLSTADIEDVFAETESVRKDRAKMMVGRAMETQQVHAQETAFARFITRTVVPVAGREATISMISGNFVGSNKLERLPVPKRPRTQPFNDELPAKPVAPLLPLAAGLLALGFVGWSTWDLRTPLVQTLSYHDGLFSSVTSGIASAEPLLRHDLEATNSFAIMASSLLIWIIEGYRLGSQGSPLALPSIFVLASQLVGFNKVAPIYYAISMLLSFTAPVGRKVPPQVAKAAMLVTLLGVTVSGLPATMWTTILAALPAIFAVLSATIGFFDRVQKPKGKVAPTKLEIEMEVYKKDDLPILKPAYALAFFMLAALHLAAYSTTSLTDLAIKESALLFASASVNNLYTVLRFRSLGYITSTKAIMGTLALITGQVIVGPGATTLGLWYWREGVFARLTT